MILDPRRDKTRARPLRALLPFAALGLGFPRAILAEEGSWAFLPAGHTFAPMLADPREPNSSIAHEGDDLHWDGSLGGTKDIIRWTSAQGSLWTWGGLANADLSIVDYASKFLDQSFRLEDIDFWLGTYVSESSGVFSNRLEYLHGVSHLGDWLFQSSNGNGHSFTAQTPLPWQRDELQFTDSFQPSDGFRLYGSLGYWLYAFPSTPPPYLQLGTEIYSGYTNIDGNLFRGFFTYDLKLDYVLEGGLDQNFELGVQWKASKGGSPNLRLALIYYNGNSLYGQFYQQKNSHMSLGFFVDS